MLFFSFLPSSASFSFAFSAAPRAAASLARIAPERPEPPGCSGAMPETKSIAKCSLTASTKPSFAARSAGSASAATTAVRSCLNTPFSASSCVLVLFPRRVFVISSSSADGSAFESRNQPCTTPSSASRISGVSAPARAAPPATFSTDVRQALRNASALFLCSTSASAPFRLGTGGAARMVFISAMHRSSGTRNDVSGLNVRMRRKPCSGLDLASSSSGSRRKPRLRPPSLPSICSALAPNGAPLCCGLSSAQSASIRSLSTSAMHGSKKSGFSESTQNSNVRRPRS